MDCITDFSGKYIVFSTFSNSLITYKGESYPSVEIAFQSIQERKRFWHKRQSPEELMFILCSLKFMPGSAEREVLDSTKGVELVHCNTWHDNFWGDCICERCKSITGRNELGKILMRIRDEGGITP